jgi:hypothetical protein
MSVTRGNYKDFKLHSAVLRILEKMKKGWDRDKVSEKAKDGSKAWL